MKTRTAAPAPGTRPEGITEEKAAARYVRDLFSRIAGRYDLLNHLLSFQLDRYWRHVVARQFRHRMAASGVRVLDLCCGTADLTLAVARQGHAPVVGCDFSHPMLTRARQKMLRRSLPPLLVEGDALQLPFTDGTFDLVVSSFGFRNLVNYRAGLTEIWRVLRPGGEVGILEISVPGGWLGPIYSLYFHRILPRVGEWISRAQRSYSYLPGSVARFPEKGDITAWMQEAGFTSARAMELTGGIVTFYLGRKPQG
ncbi:MAG TPA: ubiquinone/menaquinone biosynthesis methyltransferase [Terriglobia bacterium]